jgi:uroporphyrinogen-III synthase
VVTRADEPARPLAAGLLAEGARVRHWPTIAFAPPRDPEPLQRLLAERDAFEWLAFTSPRAVAAVAELVAAPSIHERDDGSRSRPRVAAVGAATARALRARGWPVDLVAGGTGAAGLARALVAGPADVGDRVLFPAGSRARDTLTGALAQSGLRVTRVEAYRTVVHPPPAAELRHDLAEPADALTFASPSAVEGVDRGMRGRLAERIGARPAVAIGPTTADALRRRGVARVVVAERASLDGLIEAVVACLASA